MMSHRQFVATVAERGLDLPIGRNTRPESRCSKSHRFIHTAGLPASAGVSMKQCFKENTAARAALYVAIGARVSTGARYANRVGLRVVTMAGEERAGPRLGFASSRLSALVDRLGCGEFEVILADVGDGRVFAITAMEAVVGFSHQALADNEKDAQARQRVSRKLRSERYDADRGIGAG